MSVKIKWTPAEDAKLRGLVGQGKTYEEMTGAIPGRSAAAIRLRGRWLGLGDNAGRRAEKEIEPLSTFDPFVINAREGSVKLARAINALLDRRARERNAA